MYNEDTMQIEADREQPYNSNAFDYQREIEEANKKAAERMQKKQEEEQLRQEAWAQGLDVYEMMKKREEEQLKQKAEQLKQKAKQQEETKQQKEKDSLRNISKTTEVNTEEELFRLDAFLEGIIGKDRYSPKKLYSSIRYTFITVRKRYTDYNSEHLVINILLGYRVDKEREFSVGANNRADRDGKVYLIDQLSKGYLKNFLQYNGFKIVDVIDIGTELEIPGDFRKLGIEPTRNKGLATKMNARLEHAVSISHNSKDIINGCADNTIIINLAESDDFYKDRATQFFLLGNLCNKRPYDNIEKDGIHQWDESRYYDRHNLSHAGDRYRILEKTLMFRETHSKQKTESNGDIITYDKTFEYYINLDNYYIVYVKSTEEVDKEAPYIDLVELKRMYDEEAKPKDINDRIAAKLGKINHEASLPTGISIG